MSAPGPISSITTFLSPIPQPHPEIDFNREAHEEERAKLLAYQDSHLKWVETVKASISFSEPASAKVNTSKDTIVSLIYDYSRGYHLYTDQELEDLAKKCCKEVKSTRKVVLRNLCIFERTPQLSAKFNHCWNTILVSSGLDIGIQPANCHPKKRMQLKDGEGFEFSSVFEALTYTACSSETRIEADDLFGEMNRRSYFLNSLKAPEAPEAHGESLADEDSEDEASQADLSLLENPLLQPVALAGPDEQTAESVKRDLSTAAGLKKEAQKLLATGPQRKRKLEL